MVQRFGRHNPLLDRLLRVVVEAGSGAGAPFGRRARHLGAADVRGAKTRRVRWAALRSTLVLLMLAGFSAAPGSERAALVDSVPTGSGALAQGGATWPDSFQFESEAITLTVAGSTARVTGRYTFRSISKRAQRATVFYPFPIDASHHVPDSIGAWVLTAGGAEPLPFRWIGELGIELRVPLQPDSATPWTVTYQQRIAAACASYILSSTGAWGRPLDVATYRIVHPAGWRDVQVTPAPDSATTVDGWRILRSDRRDYRPQGDLSIRWTDPHLRPCAPAR